MGNKDGTLGKTRSSQELRNIYLENFLHSPNVLRGFPSAPWLQHDVVFAFDAVVDIVDSSGLQSIGLHIYSQ